jgi:hypothetical protein
VAASVQRLRGRIARGVGRMRDAERIITFRPLAQEFAN